MKTKTNLFMKRIMPIAMALLFVLSTVLVPINAAAEEVKPKVLAKYIMKKGEKWELTVYDAAENAKITYKTSKKSVATVSKKGIVTAKKKGNATITTTVKQGKAKYTIKTKVVVKTKLTSHDYVFRGHGELGLAYQECFNIADANGWLANEDIYNWFEAGYNVVQLANDMAANKDDYTEEEMEAAIEEMLLLAEQIEELLPGLLLPYEEIDER